MGFGAKRVHDGDGTLQIVESPWTLTHVGALAPAKTYYRSMSVTVETEHRVLLCDPLTKLVAYPSFEETLISLLPFLAPKGLHLAIGDVDGLGDYVSAARDTDHKLFGHLAGNDCMRRVGLATQEWSTVVAANHELMLCATFGGDEVIVASVGRSHEEFGKSIEDLAEMIRATAPRPCSFAYATTILASCPRRVAHEGYRRMVSRVDRELFRFKEELYESAAEEWGRVHDVGFIGIVGSR